MFGKTASLVRLMCKPREATISWLHLACVSRRRLQNRLHVWSRSWNKRLGGLHVKPLVKPSQEPCQTGPDNANLTIRSLLFTHYCLLVPYMFGAILLLYLSTRSKLTMQRINKCSTSILLYIIVDRRRLIQLQVWLHFCCGSAAPASTGSWIHDGGFRMK